MNSIAKILCLGNLESNDSEKRNTALTIVSQMLLDSSPKRKRRCVQLKNSPTKENILVPATMDTYTEIGGKKEEVNLEGAVGGMIADTMSHSPLKLITNVPLETTSPPKKNSETSNTRLSSSINLPINSDRVGEKVKKNLSADCVGGYTVDNEVIEDSPSNRKKSLSFNINLENVALNKSIKSNSIETNDTTLDGSLLDYVKDGRQELDKIWFDDEPNDKTVMQKKRDLPAPFSKVSSNSSRVSTEINEIIEETPSRKRADFWLLKEKRELSGKSSNIDGKKLKQTKLGLGVRQKAVDISTLAGFNGGGAKQPGQVPGGDKDEDIIPGSPASSQICDEIPRSGNFLDDINTLESTEFRPEASSTQRSEDKGDFITNRATTSKKPTTEFVYKRDAVKKKSERAKLPGWDCYECDKYYNAMSLSTSKVKARMNACSRHRDKFNPNKNETPPGFWNPLFPDTQECKEKGMYVSVHCPSNE